MDAATNCPEIRKTGLKLSIIAVKGLVSLYSIPGYLSGDWYLRTVKPVTLRNFVPGGYSAC